MAAVYSSVLNVGNILKKYYEDDMQYINGEDSMPLLKEIEDAGIVEVNGDGESWTVDTEGPFGGGVGAYTEEGDLPLSFAQNSVQASCSVKLFASTFSITEKLMHAAANNKGAFSRGLDKVMKEARIKLDRLLWFVYHSDGTGCFGKVLTASNAASSVITLDTTITDGPTLALYPNIGDEVEAWSDKAGAGATKRSQIPRVTAVAVNFTSFTVDANVSAGGGGSWVDATDYVFLKNSRSTVTTTEFNHPNGFLNMVDTTAVHLYDPATVTTTWWKSKTIDGGGLIPTEDVIMRMMRKLSFRNNGRKPTHFMYNQVHAQDLIKLYQGRQTEEYKGGQVTPGHEGLAPWHIPGGKPLKLIEDDYQAPGRFDFFDVKVFRRQWLKKPSMLDKGAPLSALRVDNKAYWVGHITGMGNIFNRMRPATGYISNVGYTATLW